MGPMSHANTQVIQVTLKKILIDPVYLNGPKVRLSGPKVVPNGPSASQNYPRNE